jgi:DNA-directed RNA polymerase specialized sigma subunit
VFHPTNPVRKRYPYEGVSPKQKLACALWFCGDSKGPMSQRQIAQRMACSQQNVLKLIRKALRRIRANGYNPVRATARAA